MELQLPTYVITTARILLKEGYKAYLVGGAVRSTVLGVKPADYDIATDALPEQLIALFPKAISVGAAFGTIVVAQRNQQGEYLTIEVTTLRSEEAYVKGRWPSKVTFVGDIKEDVQRRDFTMNAMAFELGQHGVAALEQQLETDQPLEEMKSFSFDLIDYFGGQEDIKAKIIRTVGNPMDRFTEDGLRTFRACRFASQLEFTIEPETKAAITKCLTVAGQVSIERIRDEFMKLLLTSPHPSLGIELLNETGLLNLFLPELVVTQNLEQPIGHAYDVYHHTLRAVDLAPDRVKLAVLFHDLGKAKTQRPDGHFYGHDQVGADMAEQIMKRLRFSTKEIQQTTNLVRWHMFYYPYSQAELESLGHSFTDTDESMTQENQMSAKFWSDSAVRRFIKRVGIENLEDLFALRIADGTSEPSGMWDPQEIVALQARISKVLAEDVALKLQDLALSGTDLMQELSLKPGPIIGKTLAYLLECVVENPNVNNKEELLRLAREYINLKDQNSEIKE